MTETTDLKMQRLVHELQVHQVELEAQNQELVCMQHKLEEARDRYADLYDYAPVGYFTFDARGVVVEVNLAGASLIGLERELIVGKPFSVWIGNTHVPAFFEHLKRVFASKGKVATELELNRSNGKSCEISLDSVKTAENGLCRSILVDVTQRKRQEYNQYLAHYDVLTGLPNRILFQDRVNQAIASTERNGRAVALLFLDLDRFKSVNDSLGHEVGDKLLKSVAGRLKGCVRKVDTVARLAGDEFVLVLPDIVGGDHVSVVAENILESMKVPFSIEGHSLSISASIGAAVYPNDGRDFQTLIRNADSAMYHAKKTGRNKFQFYTEEMNARALESLAMESELRNALAHGELELHYQPQIEIRSGKIVGMEALIRWHRPGGGWVPPSKFIPIAEERGLIIPIFNLVLLEACSRIRKWQEMGLPSIPVAINISALQIRRQGLIGSISRALHDTGLDPGCLELELTESVIMHEVDATIQMMEELEAMGLKLSIDDFGIGYSSLSYLRRFPIHKLKIAHAFVADLPGNPDAAAIASAIISMAKSLKLKVIAEGVETKAQLEFLESKGCDEIQGYYFSEALTAEEFTGLLRSGRLFRAESQHGHS